MNLILNKQLEYIVVLFLRILQNHTKISKDYKIKYFFFSDNIINLKYLNQFYDEILIALLIYNSFYASLK